MKDANRTTVLRRALRYVAHARTETALALLSALITPALALRLAVLMGRAFDLLPGTGKVDFPELAYLLIHISIAAGLAALARCLCAARVHRAACRMADGIRREAFAQLQRLPLDSFDSHPADDAANRVIEDVEAMAGDLPGLPRLLSCAVTILGALLLMLRISAGTAAAVMLMTPAPLFGAAYISRRAQTVLQRHTDAHTEQTALIDGIIRGTHVAQAFGQRCACQRSFDEASARREDAAMRAALCASLTKLCARFANFLLLTCAACLGALSAVAGGASIGRLACLIACASLYIECCAKVPGDIARLRRAFSCAARVLELIDNPAIESDAPENAGLSLEEPWLRTGTIRENIALARPGATYENVVAAAKAARAHSLIRRIPGGYEAMVGEGGIELTDGQEQLICLARAKLHSAPVSVSDGIEAS